MPYKDPAKHREAVKRYDQKRKGLRTRSWACIVYPESAPEDWIERLKSAHIETFISPLHDSDVTATGERKKPHFHVLAFFPSPVPAVTAMEYFQLAGVTAPPEMVKNARGYARYLVHLDDHDKHRYDEAKIICLSGADWKAAALDDGEAADQTLDEIEDWIDKSGCVSYAALCRFARCNRPDWTHTIRTHTIHLTALMKSILWESGRVETKDASRK